jgi:tripartite-type tricarboxylate transporter receptor subunit TctC
VSKVISDLEHMQATLGQPVIIENVGGASGSIGVGRVARARPDGYTLGFGSFSTPLFAIRTAASVSSTPIGDIEFLADPTVGEVRI